MNHIKALILLLFICATLNGEPLDISVEAESALLINADTGAILYEKNPKAILCPASITKLATALYVLKVASNDLATKITAEQDALAWISEEGKRKSNHSGPAYWLEPGGTHMGIKKGEELTLKDLLYGLMVASANDAANVIAQHVAGTVPKFMIGLNKYLKEIGCQNTTFYNPHGLYHPKHQTTAHDMALIMRVGLKDPLFRELIATKQYTRPKTNKQESSVLVQNNRLIRKGKYFYAKAIGGKTGYISAAGHTIVAVAQQDDRTLIAVLLKTKERNQMFLDAVTMFEAAFNQPKVERLLLKEGPQKFALELPGQSAPIATYLKENVSIEYYPAEEPKIKCFLYWTAKELPIKEDQVVGELHLKTEEGKIMRKVSLYAQDEVHSSWFKRVFGFCNQRLLQ